MVYYDSGFVTEIQTGSSPLERNIDILYTHQSGWIQYSTTVGSITGTQVNTVTILPFTGEETIPYTGGTCFTGHNPMSGSDYAVANTDNVDCEEIVVESPNP